MRLTDRICLVGSGGLGVNLTDPFDCHIYLIDGGDELAIVDVGSGFGIDAILENVRRDGYDPARISHVILTHAHGDHAGGSARMLAALDDRPMVYLSSERAEALRTGDEVAVSIDIGKTVGIYPSDYTLEPCRVDVELADGSTIQVGDLSIEVFETPGHADGHVSLLFEENGKRQLFAGDVVFFGGKILLQAIHDCRLDRQIASLRKLRSLEVDGLFPGHFTFSLADGQQHIERANQVLDKLLIPEQAVGAW